MTVDAIKLRISEVLNLCCYLKDEGNALESSVLWKMIEDKFESNSSCTDYTQEKIKKFHATLNELEKGTSLIPFHCDDEMKMIASEMMKHGVSNFFLVDPEIPFHGGYLACDGSSFEFVDGGAEFFVKYMYHNEPRKLCSRFRITAKDKKRIDQLLNGYGTYFTEDGGLFFEGMKFPESQTPYVVGIYTIEMNDGEISFENIGKAGVNVEVNGVKLIPESNTLIELTAASINERFVLVKMSTFRRGYYVSQGSYNLLFKVPNIETNQKEFVYTSGLGFYDEPFDRGSTFSVPIDFYLNELKNHKWLAIDEKSIGVWIRNCLGEHNAL